jgi:hypothetical protein
MTDEEVYLLCAQRLALQVAKKADAQPKPRDEPQPERRLENYPCVSPTLH